jgi:hypothetical protein
VKAARTRELRSYSLSNLLLSNAGNVIHSFYVFHLPVGPLWVLHTFYLITTALMLVWYLRCVVSTTPSPGPPRRPRQRTSPGQWTRSVDRRQDREIPAVTI